jgi:hypothetical protein
MKTMAFNGRDPVRSRTVIHNNIIKNNTFSYPACSMSYQSDRDYTVKLSKFLQTAEIIEEILKPCQFHKPTRLKKYITLALPTLFYGWKTWAIREQDKTG